LSICTTTQLFAGASFLYNGRTLFVITKARHQLKKWSERPTRLSSTGSWLGRSDHAFWRKPVKRVGRRSSDTLGAIANI